MVKKYPSLKQELERVRTQLTKPSKTGTPLGYDCYKIRMAVASKNKEKSGGARIITNVYIAGQKVFLLSIYDKTEQQSISPRELKDLLKLLPE